MKIFVISSDELLIEKLRDFWGDRNGEILHSSEHPWVCDEIGRTQPNIVVLDSRGLRYPLLKYYEDLNTLETTRHIPLIFLARRLGLLAHIRLSAMFRDFEQVDYLLFNNTFDRLQHRIERLIASFPNPYRQ